MTKREADRLAVKMFGPEGVAIRNSSKVPIERYQIGILQLVKEPPPPPRIECRIIAQGATWEAAFAGAGGHVLREFDAYQAAQPKRGPLAWAKKLLALPEEIKPL